MIAIENFSAESAWKNMLWRIL